jgi:galactokinase
LAALISGLVATFEVRAPGRVNLIGEHTDYNDGFVLPAAISLEIRLTVEPNDDRRVDIRLAEGGDQGGFVLDAIGGPTGTWIDYVAGVARELVAARRPVGGFSGVLSSSLPMGSGLSSSAALELASAWALLAAGAGGAGVAAMDRMELAQICQRAEGAYVGVKTGLMDQFASSCGVAGHALLLDCRSLDWRPVALPAGLVLVAVNTGSPRRLAASQYNERRAQCERGVEILAARGEPVRALRDATMAMLDGARGELGDVIYRRCRHVVEENERALLAVAALEADDRAALGVLFAASHASLRDLYEVSSPALDAAVEIAARTPGVVATRMTGGGFGGCTVNLVEQGAADALRAALERDYTARTGLIATVHELEAADGAGLVP